MAKTEVKKKEAYRIEGDLKNIQHMLLDSDGEITPSIAFLMAEYNDDVNDLKDRLAFWVLVSKVFLQQDIDRHKGWAKDQAAVAKRIEANQASMYRVTCQAMLNHGIADIKDVTEYSSAKPEVKTHFEIEKKDLDAFFEEYPQYSVPVITLKGANAYSFSAGQMPLLSDDQKCNDYSTTYELDKAKFTTEMLKQYSLFSDAYRMANGEAHLKMSVVEVLNDVCNAYNQHKDKPSYVTARIEYTMLIRANNKPKNAE